MTLIVNARRSPRRSVLILLVMAGLVILGGCDGPRSGPPAATQSGRPPERTPEQAAYDLLDALLLTPMTAELPPGYTTPPPRDAILRLNPQVQTPGHQALGAVYFRLTGPNAVDSFIIFVAATADAAATSFSLPGPLGTAAESYTPAGFEGPARCRFVAAMQAGAGGSTSCAALAGNVIVYAYTQSRDDPRRGNDADTVTLIRLALAHVRAVQAAEAGAAAPAGTRVMRVGLLGSYWANPGRILLDRLQEKGWVRSHNLALEYRFYADQPERAPDLAAELVRAGVDVILAEGRIAARAAKDATTTIPVVFLLGEDPIAAGLVESYARPGGNVTGVSYPVDPSLAAKRLDLLAEAAPSIRRVGVLVGDASGPTWRELEETARARAVELLPLVVRNLDELAGALADGAAAGAQALLMTATLPYYATGDFLEYFNPIIRFAQQQRLPLVPDGDDSRQLLAYSPSYQALWATGAVQVDRVLRGATPTQTPVELVKEFELTINLNVAQSLGISISPSVLARATRIVQPGAVTPTRVR